MQADQVAESVYRLGTRWVNFYLVVEQGQITVIDGGYSSYVKQLLDALDSLGMSPEAVAAIFVTHHHVDHVGIAYFLRSRQGTRVFVHQADADKIGGRERSHPPSGFFRQCGGR